MGATHFDGPVISENGFETNDGSLINGTMCVTIYMGSVGSNTAQVQYARLPEGYVNASILGISWSTKSTVTTPSTFDVEIGYASGTGPDIAYVANQELEASVAGDFTLASTAQTTANQNIYVRVTPGATGSATGLHLFIYLALVES